MKETLTSRNDRASYFILVGAKDKPLERHVSGKNTEVTTETSVNLHFHGTNSAWVYI